MRIPTSVIVMSLLTAAPFGLAIRDTLNKKPMPADELDLESFDDYDVRSARRDRAALEEYEREMAREEAERKRKAKESLKLLDTVFGAERASPGPYFRGIELGGSYNYATESQLSKMETRDGFLMPFAMSNGDGGPGSKVDRIGVQIDSYAYDEEPCELLREKLTAAWGPSVQSTWINSETHVRATLDPDGCRLSFVRFADAAAWVNALPVDLVGMSAAKAEAKLGDGIEAYDDAIEFASLGTGYGTDGTTNTAYLENNKVTGITVTTDTDFDTLVAIRDALSAKLKAQPTRDEDSGAWIWKKKPGYRLTQSFDSNRFKLIIGKDPYQ